MRIPHGGYTLSLGDKLLKARTSDVHGFLPQELLSFSLPARRTHATVWERHNGKYTFTVTAGTIKDLDGSLLTELPSGKYARAALLFLFTQAKFTNNAQVSIDQNYRAFTTLLGMEWQGVKRSKEALKQLMLVSSATFTIIEQTIDETTGEEHYVDTGSRFSESMDLWALDGRTQMSNDQQSTVTLSPMMMDLLKRAAPLNIQAWQWILRNSKSSMALDIYAWLCGRLFRCNGPARVTWVQLYDQFGSTAPMKRFKQHFRAGLSVALLVYPEAHITEDTGLNKVKGFKGFHLRPSPDPRDSTLPEDKN